MSGTKPNGKPHYGGPGFKAKKGQKTNWRTDDAPGGRKADADTVQERVELCAELLFAHQMTKTEVHKEFAKRFKLRPYVVDSIYIPRANKLARERSRMTSGQAKDISMELLRRVARGGNNRELLGVVDRFVTIFGLGAAMRHEISGPGGSPVATKDTTPLPELSRARLVEVLEQLKPQSNGHTERKENQT